MSDTTLTITCPNGHYEMTVTGKSRTIIHGTVLGRSDPKPCPACGELEEWEWSDE